MWEFSNIYSSRSSAGIINVNVWALESALADAERRHPDAFILLGNLLADGPGGRPIDLQ
jgi:hypothetical protein